MLFLLEQGSSNEDVGLGGSGAIVVDHFYDPRLGDPLEDGSINDNTAIGIGALKASLYPQQTALARGDGLWAKAIAAYKNNDKQTAYDSLGHALHLMTQDMTQPAHVHNDPHLPAETPVNNFLQALGINWQGLNGSNGSLLELHAENSCLGDSSQGPFPGGTAIPTDIPSTHNGNLELDVAEAAARFAYDKAIFNGTVDLQSASPSDTGSVDIGGNPLPLQGTEADTSQPAQDCAAGAHWEAPALARVRPLCSNPTFTYSGTAFGHFTNDFWNIATIESTVWNPYGGVNKIYIHPYNQVLYGQVAIPGCQQNTLECYLQSIMLPISANYTAALLSQFAKAVDPVPPQIEAQLNDSNGDQIEQKGFSGAQVFLTVTDPSATDTNGNALFPTPSGVTGLQLEALDGQGGITGTLVDPVAVPPSLAAWPNSITHTFSDLTPGLYQAHAVDGMNNHSYSTFTVVTTPPTLAIGNELGTLANGSYNAGVQFYAIATQSIAPVKTLNVFQNGSSAPYPLTSLSPLPSAIATFTEQLPTDSWYWAQTCDAAMNCYAQLFGSFGPNSVPPPPPPGPPAAPKGGSQRTKPLPVPPLPSQPNPNSLLCLSAAGTPAAGLMGCGPGPGGLSGLLAYLEHLVSGDPNSMTGPQGSVVPGQLMTYTIEFENVGSGVALGVYVNDVLDPALDDTTLTVKNMYALTFSSGVPTSTTTANFPWSYDAQTRTVSVLAGNADSNAGGSFVVEAKLKPSVPPGTVINNQARVYFPNALQQMTPTNTVISAVPIQPQLASIGASSATYLSTAGLGAKLSVGTVTVPSQSVGFQLADFSTTTLTNAAGQATASLFVSTGAGNYNLGLNYSGDNFYFLPTAANSTFAIAQRNVHLQSPFASARATETAHVTVSMTDDQGQALQHQTDAPKTIYLELVGAGGNIIPIQSSLLSGTTASFAFSMPSPLQLNWTLRARFGGDSRYAAAISTGVLSLIDDVPPVVTLTSPHGGAIVTNSGQVTVNYTVTDNDDLAPSATAYLLALDGSQSQIVSNRGSVPAASLNPGSWTVIVSALDWAGNVSSATSGPFLVTSDILPPRTSLVTGSPNFGSNPIFVSSQTGISLQAVDDRTTVGDGLGVGVAQTQYSIDGGSWTVYTSPFVLTGEGQHHVSFFSTDLAGNTESPHTAFLSVDSTPPSTRLLVDGVAASSTSIVVISTDVISFSPSDAGSGVAQTVYALDGSTIQTVAVSTFSLAVGTHTVSFQSVDNVGNLEALNSVFAVVRSSDTTPPAVAWVPASGSTIATNSPTISAVYIDTGTGVNPSSVRLALDGVDVTTRAIVTVSSANFAPSTALSDGPHTAVVQVSDLAGNRTISTSTFLIDTIPPVTTLLVDGLTTNTTHLIVVSTDSLGFAATDSGSGVAQTLYALDGGTATVFVSTFSLAVGTHIVSFQSVDNVGNLEPAKSASLTVLPLDRLPPRTSLVIGAPVFLSSQTYVSSSTPFGFSAVDDKLVVGDGTGVGTAKTFYAVDGASFTAYSGTFTLVAQGTHTISFYSVDFLGNTEIARSSTVAVDAAPPVSSLAIGSPQFALSSMTVLVSSLTPIGIAAIDPASSGVASGVGRTFYQVNGGTWTVYAASFTLAGADGPQSVSFYSQDNVLNTEAVKSSTVLLDAAPPEAALLSPATCDSGLCRVVKGKFPVLGTARDLNFAGYVLDYAAGQNAATGYALIGSGSAAVSSATLATWDASSLSGWQTLRLTATDLVGNVSVVSLNVFVGDPGELLILGNHDVFNMPQGVAADGAGDIYVADTNANRVAVFTATGAFAAAYGQAHGDRDDMSRVSTSTVWFNKPKGVALDAAGNVYIADTNNDRVLKLSATGQLLLALGRQIKGGHDAAPQFSPGKGPGEFNKPSGVAVDAAGNIYVADTNNNRIQVLSSTGAYRLAFSLPPLPALHADENEDHDADQLALGRPLGIAVDAAGKIYVADPAGGRALVFGATGGLLLTVPITGATKDGRASPGRPEGIAVSSDGYCLLVSDRKFDRVLRFDALGDQALAFGAPGKLDDDKPAPGIVFHKPVGLALAPDGTLLVADRNNDRVERFGLPTGKPASVVPQRSGDDRGLVAKDVLDSASGGTVARPDKAGVAIPPGALADDLQISVSTLSPAGASQAGSMGRVAGGKGLAPASAPVEYGPEGTRFAAPVTLTVPYDPGMAAVSGMSEDSLKINYWNKDKGDWETLDSIVDKTAHTVAAKTPHFSLYQVLGSTGTAAIVPLAIADPTFTFHDAYAFPNPVRGTRAVTIRMQTGLADSVEVHAYDLTGRRAYSSSNFLLNPAFDDGNGKGAQYTYDNVWDISGVGSGVYTYVITAKKAGMADIHKSGRIGVIK